MTGTDHAEALGVLNRVTTERDIARHVAVRLEQETAHLALVVQAQLEQLADLGNRVNDQHEEIRGLREQLAEVTP